MYIEKKYLRSLEANLPISLNGKIVIPTIKVNDVSETILRRSGIPESAKNGDTILPSVVGPKTRENSEGREVIRRDLAKETLYRDHVWHYEQWHGKDRVEVEEIVSIPYERYPRDFVHPAALEITLFEDANGIQRIALPAVTVDFSLPDETLRSINLMLEIAGGCELLDISHNPVIIPVVRRLNWEILPSGEHPWPAVEKRLPTILKRNSENKRRIFEMRFKTIQGYGPDYWAVGLGGFSGYLVAVFAKQNLAVLECAKYGNATYVLSKDWESISRLSKADILRHELHEARLVHIQNWSDMLASVLHKLGAILKRYLL